MPIKPIRSTTSSPKRAFAIAVALLAVVIVVAVVGLRHNHPTSGTAATTPQPTVDASTTADGTKSRFANNPTTSPSTTPIPTGAVQPTTTPAANYISSFSVVTRSDGFHVATVLTGLTGGTCSVTIKPTGGSSVQQSGSVILSGQTYMCDFGGDIAGSGTTGSASLVVTTTNGVVSTSEATF